MARLTGLPTQTALDIAPGKATSTRDAKRASSRLDMPATEFCSCSTSGTRRVRATSPPGTVT